MALHSCYRHTVRWTEDISWPHSILHALIEWLSFTSVCSRRNFITSMSVNFTLVPPLRFSPRHSLEGHLESPCLFVFHLECQFYSCGVINLKSDFKSTCWMEFIGCIQVCVTKSQSWSQSIIQRYYWFLKNIFKLSWFAHPNLTGHSPKWPHSLKRRLSPPESMSQLTPEWPNDMEATWLGVKGQLMFPTWLCVPLCGNTLSKFRTQLADNFWTTWLATQLWL